MNSTGVSEPRVVDPGHRPDRRRDAGRHRTGRDPEARRPDRPARLRARSGDTPDDPRASRPRPATTVPAAALSGDQVAAADDGTDQTGQRAVNFTLKDNGKEQVRRLHREPRRRVLRDRPRRRRHLGARHQEPDPDGQVQIKSGGGIGGFPRRRPTTSSRSCASARCRSRSQELANDTISADARRGVPAAEPPRGRDRDPARDLLHDPPLPAAGRHRQLRADLLHARRPRDLPAHPGDAHPRRHRGLRALGGHGGRRQHPDLRADRRKSCGSGKSLPAAIEAGFDRAWNSILDSNVSSLITATILYLFGSSTIRGFALVLIIGVLVSMFTAITVTRTILRVVVRAAWARKARAVRRDRGRVHRRADRPARPAARGAHACLTSSASGAGSSSSRC